MFTKTDIVENIISVHQLPKKQATEIVNLVFNEIIENIKNGEKVFINGFGTFNPVTRAARTARNPKTGEAVHVPEKKAMTFKAARQIKETLNHEA